MKLHRKDLQSGRSHISLIAYLPSDEISNSFALNAQSMNANIIRTYIMRIYGITVSHFTFAFEQKEGVNDRYNVGVLYSAAPILAMEN